MKLAVAGKGGVGKTTFTTWLADYLARQGHTVWMVDADTALSLGAASGLAPEDLPKPLVTREDLVRQRIGSGYLNLNPEVGDLPEELGVDLPLGGSVEDGVTPGWKRLLVMGTVAGAGGGCACAANSLLKALLAHLLLQRGETVLVDLEAGVEHLGRGTIQSVDGLVVVSEPSRRGLETAANISRLAEEMGLSRRALFLNRHHGNADLPAIDHLPPLAASLPRLESLQARQLHSPSVLGLEEQAAIDAACAEVLRSLS
ncbi:P-loop NTPase [Desulfohalovibrio reitneri]|uniref:ATP-binding protein n=1 Tax=Desulfohalovibrio reitneri TaxID=1307759 RepID=UPI0004A6F242|nr:P-loop NTPase [Desulfohalovibrio reitneri]